MYAKHHFLRIKSTQEFMKYSRADFVGFCKNFLDMHGHTSVRDKSREEFGADLVSMYLDQRIYILCQHTSKLGTISPNELRIFHGIIARDKISYALIITTMDLGNEVLAEARKMNIQIITDKDIRHSLKVANPIFEQKTVVIPSPPKQTNDQQMLLVLLVIVVLGGGGAFAYMQGMLPF
jgi:hypothetical protein